MSVTYVDTDLLERMQDRMSQVLSRVEECAGSLRQMHSQMLAEDLRLSSYPQWEQALEHCDSARRKADLLCETVTRFLTVLEGAPEEYRQLEHQHARSIENLSVRMRTLGAGLAGVMAAEYPTGLAEGGQDSRAMKLEQQMVFTSQAVEAANLSAVTSALKEEYAYDRIVPGISSPAEEEEKNPERKRQNVNAILMSTYVPDIDEDEEKERVSRQAARTVKQELRNDEPQTGGEGSLT